MNSMAGGIGAKRSSFVVIFFTFCLFDGLVKDLPIRES